jgi:hypothetical protein
VLVKAANSYIVGSSGVFFATICITSLPTKLSAFLLCFKHSCEPGIFCQHICLPIIQFSGLQSLIEKPTHLTSSFYFSFVSFVHYLFDCGLPFYKKHPFWVQLWYIFLRKMPPDFHQSKSQKSPCILCELGTSEVLIYLLPLKDATKFFGVL